MEGVIISLLSLVILVTGMILGYGIALDAKHAEMSDQACPTLVRHNTDLAMEWDCKFAHLKEN